MSASMYAPDYLRGEKDKNLHNISDMIEEQITELTTTEAKLKLAVEALGFYGDENNQVAPTYKPTGKPGADFTALYRMDNGKRARETLKQIEEMK